MLIMHAFFRASFITHNSMIETIRLDVIFDLVVVKPAKKNRASAQEIS